MKNNLEIGSRIRNIREGMKLSRSAFSEKINISEVFLSQVERGEKSISLNTLMSICNMTGVSSDYILFGDEKNSSTANRTLKLLNQLPPEANSLIFSIANSIKDIYKKK